MLKKLDTDSQASYTPSQKWFFINMLYVLQQRFSSKYRTKFKMDLVQEYIFKRRPLYILEIDFIVNL